MAITNNPIHNTNTTALQGHNAENTAAPQQNNGVVARGVCMLQKVWLQLTGKAGDKHTKQLTNLKAQVKHEFGEGGLMVLNDKLSAKKWDSEDSKKIFSQTELDNLRKEAKEGAGLAEFRMGLHQELEAKLRGPALEKAEAADAAALDRSEKIEATIPQVIQDKGDELIKSLIEGADVSRFEAIQSSQALSNKANQIIGDPSISLMIHDAMKVLKLDTSKDIRPNMIDDMIKDMIELAKKHCVPDAEQEVTLTDQELDGLMKEGMTESLAKLTDAKTDNEKIHAVRDFLTGNLQDFFAHAIDMYFDRLDNASPEILLGFTRTAYEDLARGEATRIVDEAKAGFVAEKRNQIETELKFDLSKRDTYPELSRAVTDVALKIARTELETGNTSGAGHHLDLLDHIASHVKNAEVYINAINYGDDNVLDELIPLARDMLDPNASWAGDFRPGERQVIDLALANMNASQNGNFDEKREAVAAFIDTLGGANRILSDSYYQQHLVNNKTFSYAMNAEATNLANKQIRDERMAAG